MAIFVRRAFVAALLCGIAGAQSKSAKDTWEPLRFLIGSWEGDVSGKPGEGRSVREYRLALNDRFLEVRNKSTYPPQPKNPKGEVHEDWSMISYDNARKLFVLRQFHVEGFVNQYTGGPAGADVVQFASESIENIPAGYRARETYTRTGPDTFIERFEIAEPAKDFELYDETKFRRKR